MNKRLSWDIFFKIICGLLAILLLISIIIKLFEPNRLADIKLETVLIILAVVIVLPYITNLEAFGVKMEIKKKIDDISSKINALPDYILGKEYHSEGDLTLAERAYRTSLEKCNDFWPAIIGIASICIDKEDYEKAIMEYNRVLEIDPNNPYVFNDLAAIYLDAPSPITDARKALEMANKSLELVPSMASSLYYKGEALNKLSLYDEAYSLLKGMVSKDLPKGHAHWTMCEFMIATSQLGKGISEESLKKLLFLAENNGEGKRLLEYLANTEEKERWKEKDLNIINKFIKDHKTFIN